MTVIARRRFLSGLAAGGIVATTAGCTDLFDDASDEIEELEQKIADLEEDLAERDAELADLEDEVSALEAEIDTLDDEVDELETELLQRLADRYADTDDLFEVAMMWFDDGDLLYDQGEYHDAARHLIAASRYWDSISFVCLKLYEITDEHGIDEAAAIADESAQLTAEMREAMVHLSNASFYMGQGSYDAADAELDLANDSLDAAEEYEFARPSEFSAALGL